MTTTALADSEYAMVLDALEYCASEGITPDPKLVAIKDAFEAGTRRELPGEGGVEKPAGARPQGGAKHANQYGACTVRMPSPEQVAFVNRLLRQRAIPATITQPRQLAIDWFKAGTANLRQTSDLITWLVGLPERADLAPEPASPKQISFIKSLVQQRAGAAAIVGDADVDALSHPQARALLDQLTALPKLPPAPVVELTDGIYRKADGRVYKVYGAQADRSRKLAKLLVIDAGEPHFEYAGMAQRFVHPDERMTLEQAKEFGVIYGVCCVCGATLTDETSIAEGIGPICAKRWKA